MSMARCTACAASSMRIWSISGRRASPIWRVASLPPRRWVRPATSRTCKYCQEIFEVLKAHAIDISSTSAATTRRHGAHRLGGGEERRPRAALHPHSQDHRQRSGRHDHTPGFPSAARFVAQAFTGANLDNLSLPGVYMRGGHGPACRLPDRRVGAGRKSGRRAASDLSARARLRRGKIPVRREGGLRAARPLRHGGVGRHPRRQRHADHHQADGPGARRTPMAMSSCPAPARWPTCSARRSRTSSASSGCAATPSAICSAPLSAASDRWTSARRARSARRRCSSRSGAPATARWRSSRIGDYAVEYPLMPLDPSRGQDTGDGRRPHRRGRQRCHAAPSIDYLRPLVGDMPEVARLRGAKVAKASVLGDGT